MEDQPIFDERLLPKTNELIRKNFNKNAKYQEVIWKALCELEDYIEIYGNESWHSKKPKYFPHIPSDLLFPNYEDPILDEQCNVYLYETIVKGLKKFGISNDLKARKKQGGSNTYHKYLSSFLCTSRIEALSIEFCLMEEKHKLRDFPYSFFNKEQEWIDNKTMFEEYQLKIEKYKLLPNELSFIPVELFNKLIPKFASDYRKLDPFEFFKKHSPKTYAIHHEAVDKVLKQIWSITPLKRLVHEKNRTDFENIYKQFNDRDKNESIDLFDWCEEE